MDPTVLSVLYFIASSHALVMTLSLWRRSEPSAPGRLMAVITALLAYKLLEGGLMYSNAYRFLPHLLDLLPGMVLVLGPVFFAYVRRMTGAAPWPVQVWLLVLLPAVVIWALNAPAVFTPGTNKIAMWDYILATPGAVSLPLAVLAQLLFMKIYLAGFLVLSWRALDRYARSMDQIRADGSRDRLRALRALTIAFIVLELVWIGLFLAEQFAGDTHLSSVSEVWLLFMAVIVLGLSVIGLQTPNFLLSREERALADFPPGEPFEAGPEASGNTVKYLYSALPQSAMAEIAELLTERLEADQLYLDETLSLTSLARAIDVKSHLLSQVINEGMGTNFYRLINGYRVEHAARLIRETNRTWPLERIAIESGFNNRVTFAKAFRSELGQTPSQYRAALRAVG